MAQIFWKNGKKFLAGLLVLAFAMPAVLFSLPQVVNAQGVVPTSDAKNLVKNTATAFSTNAEKVRTYVLNNIAYTVAKGIARQLTTSIVNWINSGFNGSPAFVTDPGQFLLNTADRIAGDLIEGSELGFLCDPFRLDIRIALGLKYRPFYDKVTCSLTGVVNNVRNSVSSFTDGNFRNGGWNSWLTLTNRPQNNVYGAYLESQNELEIRIAGRRIFDSQKLSWGGGFLSWEKCVQQPVEFAPSGLDSYYDYKPTTREKCDIQTPGSVINDQLRKALGSGIDQLNLADDFNEIVNALVVQLVTQVVGGGSNSQAGSGSNTGGLRGASAPSGGQAPLTSDLARVQDNTSLKNILTGIKSEIDNLINNETHFINVKTSSFNIIQGAETALTALKTCYDQKVNGTQTIAQNQVTTYCLIGNQQYSGQICSTYGHQVTQQNTLFNGLTNAEADTARSRMAAVDGAIQTQIAPLKIPVEADITIANTIRSNLISIRTEMETALAQNELFLNADGSLKTNLSLQDQNNNVLLLGKAQQLVNAYQSVSTRNDLHHEDKLIDAEAYRDQVVSPQMSTLMNGTVVGTTVIPGVTAQLDACTAFPYADRATQSGWGTTQ